MSEGASIADVIEGRATWYVAHADSVWALAGMPDQCVAHVITDPPYDQRTSENARTIRGAPNNRTGVADGFGRERYVPFDGIVPSEIVPRLLGVARRWVLAWCALEQIGAYAAAAGEAWVRAGIWRRRGGAPQFTGDRPAQGCEGCAIMHRAGRKRWNGGGHPAFWDCPRMATGVQPMSAERVHPTQKPVELMLDQVAQFTDLEDVILDPFCGSGTTGLACLRLGRAFVGIERERIWVDAARERLRAEDAGSTFAARRVGQVPLFHAGTTRATSASRAVSETKSTKGE